MMAAMLALILICALHCVCITLSDANTKVTVQGDNFYINDEIVYSSASNSDVHGLLLNARLIQGVFDDANTSTQYLWEYPDTHKWDPDRNVNEFVGNLSLYKSKQLLAFTVGLQGGNPFGFGNNEPKNISGQPWIVSAFDFKTGQIKQK